MSITVAVSPVSPLGLNVAFLTSGEKTIGMLAGAGLSAGSPLDYNAHPFSLQAVNGKKIGRIATGLMIAAFWATWWMQ